MNSSGISPEASTFLIVSCVRLLRAPLGRPPLAPGGRPRTAPRGIPVSFSILFRSQHIERQYLKGGHRWTAPLRALQVSVPIAAVEVPPTGLTLAMRGDGTRHLA